MGEWMAGYKQVKEHGFLGLGKLKNDKEAKEAFNKIDANGGGEIMLNEWCDYLKAIEIENKTKLGACLAEDETTEEAGARKAKAAAKKGKTAKAGGGGGAAAEGGGGGGGGGGKGVKTDFGLNVTKGASQELVDFVGVFNEYTGPKADAKRKEGWALADMNGNGLCSLAECETFLMKALVAKFPKTGKGKAMKEPGKDIWDAFRPCYIRCARALIPCSTTTTPTSPPPFLLIFVLCELSPHCFPTSVNGRPLKFSHDVAELLRTPLTSRKTRARRLRARRTPSKTTSCRRRSSASSVHTRAPTQPCTMLSRKSTAAAQAEMRMTTRGSKPRSSRRATKA